MPELDEVIENTEVEEETTKEEATEKVEEKEEKVEKSKKEDTEDTETTQAKNLYKALNDPKTAKTIIEAMARKVGLLGDEELTKKETKAAKKKIQDVFKEALGEDMGFLAEKLGPAIEKVLEHYDSENQERFKSYEAEKAKEETGKAVETLYSKYEDAEALEARIFELMDEISPGPNSTPYKYMEKLYHLAKAEANEASVKDKMKKKLKNNSEDATARLSSSGSREVKTSSAPSKAPSLDEALELATKSLAGKDLT